MLLRLECLMKEVVAIHQTSFLLREKGPHAQVHGRVVSQLGNFQNLEADAAFLANSLKKASPQNKKGISEVTMKEYPVERDTREEAMIDKLWGKFFAKYFRSKPNPDPDKALTSADVARDWLTPERRLILRNLYNLQVAFEGKANLGHCSLQIMDLVGCKDTKTARGMIDHFIHKELVTTTRTGSGDCIAIPYEVIADLRLVRVYRGFVQQVVQIEDYNQPKTKRYEDCVTELKEIGAYWCPSDTELRQRLKDRIQAAYDKKWPKKRKPDDDKGEKDAA